MKSKGKGCAEIKRRSRKTRSWQWTTWNRAPICTVDLNLTIPAIITYYNWDCVHSYLVILALMLVWIRYELPVNPRHLKVVDLLDIWLQIRSPSTSNERAPLLNDKLLPSCFGLIDGTCHKAIVVTVYSSMNNFRKCVRSEAFVLVVVVDSHDVNARTWTTEKDRLDTGNCWPATCKDQLVPITDIIAYL